MPLFVVTGINTDVGKTIVSAILVQALGADYWKPIQCGGLDTCDTTTVQKLTSQSSSVFHPEAYRLSHPLSPHHAARLEGLEIRREKIIIPSTKNSLVVEGSGGLMVPLNKNTLFIDLLCEWEATIILVSKNYLGSINHTLLSVEALRKRNLNIGGLIFNGNANPDTEGIIDSMTQLPVLGRIDWTDNINQKTIQHHAVTWKKRLAAL